MKKKGIIAAVILIGILTAGIALYPGNTQGGNERFSDPGENVAAYHAEDGPEEPSITVLTDIPDGEVEEGNFDIAYQVTPGRDAAVSRIYYMINGDIERSLYTYGDPEEKLSGGTVSLTYDKNSIVFYVEDTEGRTAEFAAVNQPYHEDKDSPALDESKLRPSSRGEDMMYLNNQLVIVTKYDIPDEEVMGMIEGIGGEVIGDIPDMNRYYVEVAESTEEELEAMCRQLEADYDDKIALVKLHYAGGLTLNSTDDPWWSEVPVRNDENYLNEYMQYAGEGLYSSQMYIKWQLPYRQWGLDAINAPAAWSLLPGKVDNVKIGVVDDNFHINHEDLQDLNIQLRFETDEESDQENFKQIHGTHVMGTIAAVHNNELGTAGVVDLAPGMMYGADAAPEGILDDEKIITGIRWLVKQGVRVINISIGSNFVMDTTAYDVELNSLREEGHDFLIVTSAGNAFQSNSATAFAATEDVGIRSRAIVVGAAAPPYEAVDLPYEKGNPADYTMASFTNYGDQIDVTAPGVRIFSTTAASYYPYVNEEGEDVTNPTYGDDFYFMMDGTSMAAPHVTGVAALVWSANPDLTGPEVRNVIMDSATTEVVENRPSTDMRIYEYDYYLADAAAAVSLSSVPIPRITEARARPYGFDFVENTFTIKWEITGSNTGDVTGYEIYRADEWGGPYTRVSGTSDQNRQFTETVGSWDDNADYYYKVRSITAEGYSAFSESVRMDWSTNIFKEITDASMGNAVAYGKDSLGIARDTSSPLLIDMDGNGIETLPISQGVYFNHQGGSFMTLTGWAGPSEGILARDLDGDGQISSGQELFGNNTLLQDGQPAANGFEALKDLDSNGDSVFDAQDDLFGTLLLWTDADSNGRSAAAELAGLEAAGILSIDLSYVDIDMQDAHGNIHRQISTAMKADGTIADIADVWFVRDLADSGTADDELLDVSADVVDLPDIRGFGTVHSLHQAMMMDDSGELKGLLEQFTTEPDEDARRQLIPAILAKWSGAATNLKVLEAFAGDKYKGGTGPNAMGVIYQGYSRIGNAVYQILMAHSHYRYLYEAAVVNGNDLENLTIDLTGVAGILLDRIDEDRDSGEALLLDFIIHLHILTMFDYIEYDSFYNALAERNSAYGYLAEIGRQNIIVGTDGDDSITGTSTADAYWYEYGDNILTDKGGNDTYFFADWFGNNTIRDSAGDNNILFLQGIRLDDLQVARIDGTTDISISTEVSQGKLVVRSGPAYELVFMDGTTCNLYDLLEYEEISTPEQLEQIRHDLSGFYRLTEDIDLAGIAWVPVGTEKTPFLGILDGNGHTINNLTIDMAAQYYTGLIGYNQGRIAGLSLSEVQVSGQYYAGGLAGYNICSIESCTVDGTVAGKNDVGGLAGYSTGSITSCTADVAVTGTYRVGGLAGYSTGSITACTAGGAVTSTYYAGGLAGYNTGIIEACTADVAVTGDSYTGGLAGYTTGIIAGSAVTGGTVMGKDITGGLLGYLYNGTVTNSYATVNVSGTSKVGGLTGHAYSGLIEQCYATGTVTGRSYAGGLVGYLQTAVKNSFATGNVSPGSYNAGFVGYVYSSSSGIVNSYSLSSNPNGFITGRRNITSSYFDKDLISGFIDQPEGRTTAEMKRQSAYTDAGWDFATVWTMGAEGYPVLRKLPEPVRSYTEISTPADLEAIRLDLGGSYRLTADIDLSGIEWIPLGDSWAPFTGILDGNGHTVSNVTVSLPEQDYVGLIGYNKGTIVGLSLANVQVNGQNRTGGLAGHNTGRIKACRVDGTVTGKAYTGGLAGYSDGGIIEGSAATGGTITGAGDVGGLIGYLRGGETRNSYATANVSGTGNAGGLAGSAVTGLIEQCYATGHVTGHETIGSPSAGGLVGTLDATVKNSFATGNVTPGNNTAGLAGKMWSSDSVSIVNSYSLSNNPNGLIYGTGNITGSYFNKSLISGTADQPEGRTTAEMQQQSAYTDAGWDFDTVWMMGTEGYPVLRGLPEPVRIYTEISTPAGLEAIRQDLSGNYRLTADIDLSGIEWIPLGDSQTAFTGILDGNGHTVSNVTVSLPGQDYVGLFGYNKGNIVGLSLANVRVSGRNRTGGLVGHNSGRIDACRVDGTVTGNDYTGGLAGYGSGGFIAGSAVTGGVVVGTGNYAGGLVSVLDKKGTITNSYATVNVIGKQRVGGLIGNANDGLIEQCYATGNVTADFYSGYAGGLAGYLGGTVTVKNNFATGNVSYGFNSAGFAGLIATTDAGQIVNNYSLSGNPFGFSYNTATTTASYFNKDLISGDGAQPEGRSTEEMKQQSNYTAAGWDFENVWMMGEGGYPVLRGLPEPARSYTEISTPEDLEAVRQNLYGNYRLTADIDLSGREWTPLGSAQSPFYGMLDGNGYKIENLTVSLPEQDYVGLIGYNKGEITGLTLSSVQVTGWNYTGGLAGYNLGYIDACNVDGDVAGNSYTGGLAGLNQGLIEGSAMAGGTVTGKVSSTGGLAGALSDGIIINSYAAADVSGTRQAGGLAGRVSAGIIERCYATGDVTASTDGGGFAGYVSGVSTIKDSFATGHVSSAANTAGFVGRISVSNSRIENSYSLSSNPNGFSYNAGTIVNCYFDKNLSNGTGTQAEGRTTAEMKRQSTYTDAGWDFDTVWMMGQAGYPVLKGMPEPADGTGDTDDSARYTEISTRQELLAIRNDLSGSYRLTADIDLSGTAWATMGTFLDPFTGELDGNGYAIINMRINEPGQNYVGMFGRNSGKITDLTLTNVWVSGRNYTGGLAGDNDGIIEGCTVDGTVSGNIDTGGLAGYSNGVIVGCAMTGGQVTGKEFYTGGLVGMQAGGSIRTSHAAANVSGASEVGGLAGYVGTSLIEQCQATGQVTSAYNAGGLIGSLGREATVRNSLAVAQVSSGSSTAGFVGYIEAPSAKIENCYSLSGNTNGFISNTGDLTSCYFDRNLAGGNTMQAEGRSSAEMKDQATYSGWDFENIWEMQENSYPTLRSMSGYTIVFPDTPGGDEEPDNPGDGEDPDNPGDGEDPDNPGDGEDPDNPGDGEDPDNPGDGEDPDNPGDGDEDPDDPGDGNGEDPDDPGDGDEDPDDPGDSSGDTYDPNMIYVAGDTVVYNGSTYKAKWWTKGGATPDTNQAWEKISGGDTGGDGGGTGSADAYNAAKAYVGGDRVMYEGHIYQAKWWTRGNTPGSSDVWELIE